VQTLVCPTYGEEAVSRLCDVFSGWTISLEYCVYRYRLSVVDNHGHVALATIIDTLPDAMSLAEEWMLVMSDDQEVVLDLLEARHAVKLLMIDAMRTKRVDTHERNRAVDGLQTWFSRQWEETDR
jgi:hypothetical protein